MLEQLPNLQSLVVSRLPFFDHTALLALRNTGNNRRTSGDWKLPVYPLRLLVAIRCPNTTSNGLAEALIHWPHLVYLDLSDTAPARDYAVLSNLRGFDSLQVLKLRHIGLRDEDLEVLAAAIGIRVRSLDIRDNKITDKSVRALLNTCFKPILRNGQPDRGDGMHRLHSASTTTSASEDWLPGIPKPELRLLEDFIGEDLDERFMKILTRGVVSRLASEDLPHSGITHLYISNNYLTVEGVASLVKSRRLNVLDVGDVDTAKMLGRPRAPSSSTILSENSMLFPGVEKLSPILENHAQKRLTYLRINHGVVTETQPIKNDHSHAAELNTADENTRFELNAVEPVYEMPDGQATPRYELPGDTLQIVVSPAVGERPQLTREESQMKEARRGSAFAPEVVVQEHDAEVDEPPIMSATGLGNIAQAVNGVQSQEATNGAPSSKVNTDLSIALINQRRREIRSRYKEPPSPCGLSLGHLPNMRTLILTSVPCFPQKPQASASLIRLIADAAEELSLAKQQATLESSSLYVPGRPRSMHHSHRVRELFALESIILEMADPYALMPGSKFVPGNQAAGPGLGQGKGPPSSARTSTRPRTHHRQSLSSTGDADSEAFWRSSENDFSFFGDEECGLPAREPAWHVPLATVSEKMFVSPEEDDSEMVTSPGMYSSTATWTTGGKTGGPVSSKTDKLNDGASILATGSPAPDGSTAEEEIEDVVQSLARYRKERKAAYDRVIQAGGEGKDVEGYWPGEVRVVRHPGHGGKGGGGRKGQVREGHERDCYGNCFAKGYLYP